MKVCFYLDEGYIEGYTAEILDECFLESGGKLVGIDWFKTSTAGASATVNHADR